jgi:hypothetical protein
MQIKQIALATLALAAMAQAQAFTNVSGASASSIGYIESLNAACPLQADGVTSGLNVFARTSATANPGTLGNNFTVTCTTGNFGTTAENEVRFDVNGGSLNAILFSTASTEAGASTVFGGFLPANTACGKVLAPAVLSFLNDGTGTAVSTARMFACGTTAALNAEKSVGGFLDVEPAIFKAQGVVAGDYTSGVTQANFSQAFAVGVSPALYAALQTAQGITAATPAQIAAGTFTGAEPQFQPSISRSQLASVINNVNSNQAKALGAKFLAPTLAAAADLYYCRRPNTSGTQQTAELYFLNAVTATGALAGAAVIHAPSTGANQLVNTATKLKTVLNTGTGDVKKCLNTGVATYATPAGAYAVGILSAENNPVATNDAYRLVKVQGTSVTDGLATSSQTTTAIAGQYDFVYESVFFDADAFTSAGATTNAVLTLINANVKTGAGTPGVFLNSNAGAAAETKFSRNGKSVNNYLSK